MDNWQPPPTALPPLEAGWVHVWRAHLNPDGGIGGESVLSPEERERAHRFRTRELRRRYIQAHAATRTILARYLGISADAVTFETSAGGKPVLVGEMPIAFNLSHSADRVLVAVALDDVGVDVEYHRPDFEWQPISRRFFSVTERAALESLPPGERVAGFYRCWTRKESYVKARGGGIASGLDSFSVDIAAEQPQAVVSHEDPPPDSPWTLAPLAFEAGCSGAVTLRGSALRLQYFDFSSTV